MRLPQQPAQAPEGTVAAAVVAADAVAVAAGTAAEAGVHGVVAGRPPCAARPHSSGARRRRTGRRSAVRESVARGGGARLPGSWRGPRG